jgi:ribosomal protein L31
MRKVASAFIIFISLFLAVAAMAKAKRYEVQISSTVQAGGTDLKAGTYQLEVDGNSLVFYQGKKEIAKVSVRTEELQTKNEETSMNMSGGKLTAIQLGGTKTRLVLE